MKITISGDRAEGKTTVAAAISVWLQTLGYDVSYQGHNFLSEELFTKIKEKPPSSIEKRTVIIEDKYDGTKKDSE